jgi:hypothetical protein
VASGTLSWSSALVVLEIAAGATSRNGGFVCHDRTRVCWPNELREDSQPTGRGVRWREHRGYVGKGVARACVCEQIDILATCTGSCLRPEGWARGETIGEASMVITEGMLGQLTAVGFAAGQCGQARAHLAWTERYCGVHESASVAHRKETFL